MIRIAIAVSAVLTLLIAHFTPVIGYGAQLHRVRGDLQKMQTSRDDWRKAAKGWEASFRASEELRAKETENARQAVNDTVLQCDARVKQARASAKVIKELVYAPIKLDANRCPVGGLLDPDRLRDALQPR